MAKIKELPVLERPREKAYRYGIEKLSDHELIAILIGSGSMNNSAVDIAYQMIRDSHGLFNLVQKPFSDLVNYKGIKKDKAVKIIAAFEIAKRFNSLTPNEEEIPINSEYIYQKYQSRIANCIQEHVYLIILNKKKQIIHEVNLFKGNERSVNYSITQIIQQVLIHNGSYFYIIHNHPNGTLYPSEGDMNFTSMLIREAKKLKIQMIDHLIITNHGYFSFLKS